MGAFIEALTSAMGRGGPVAGEESRRRGSLGAWLVDRVRHHSERDSRLRILERVRVTPRQVLVLVEAEGERLLVATSDGSAPAIFALGGPERIRVEGSCA